MRNPPWHRDEIILALELYSRLEPGQISHTNPEIIELSRLLNRLPIFNVRPDEVKFRNPNGVALKLSNFLAVDPSYSGKGMSSFSKLDEMVFMEFQFDQERLHRLAKQIRSIVEHDDLPNKLYLISEEEEDEMISVNEGAVIYKLHRYRERDSKIILMKKEIEFSRSGRLICEACSFDFQMKYGDLGFKYIECHHKVPLFQYSVSARTKLEDLALVCSNCHRMLHRKLDTLTVSTLKSLIAS